MADVPSTAFNKDTLIPLGIALVAIGAAVSYGVLAEKVSTLERNQELYITTQRTDSDRITRLEAQYQAILTGISEIKSDIKDLKSIKR